MILFKNYLIVLDYDPSTDILSVEWPNVQPYQLLEVEQALAILVEKIRNYDIKKLLIDASRTVSNPEMEEVRYREIVTNFVHELGRTRLQKSARIMAADKVKEEKSQQLSTQVVKETGLVVQSQNFASRQEAIQWLLATEPITGKMEIAN